MRFSKNASQEKVKAEKREPMASSFRQSVRKAPGTRMGTWQDWREGGSRSGKTSGRHGHAIRDGR
jgi:hypothetical protein